ncbi:MAG: Gfo/Idh/MocA family oxidoreductase, partial [Pirellulaceae bacterium]|nr:Gfo/Idh/MocA family oxidoreductase [Pirellulaceae bacterium]
MSSSKNSVSRRSFLRTSGAVAATASLIPAFSAKSYGAIDGANERIRVGLIGVGIIGRAHIGAINAIREKNNIEPIAVADCWETRANEGAELLKLPQSAATTDYRRLLDNKEVDYVTIETPEHR